MSRGNTYTTKHIKFLKEYAPDHTLTEIWEAFFDKFEMDVDKSNIQYLLRKYQIPHLVSERKLSKDIRECGAYGCEKQLLRRTKISGTEELKTIIDDISVKYGMKKYEIYVDAINDFIKYEDGVSPYLISRSFIKKSKSIDVDIPLEADDTLIKIAQENKCSESKVLLQALVNYCVSKFPDKKNSFSKVLTRQISDCVDTSNKKSQEKHFYTPEEIDFIREVAPNHTYEEVMMSLNTKFHTDVTYGGIYKCMQRYGIVVGKKSPTGRKSCTKNSTNNKSTDAIPDKMQKYYVDGMEEVDVKGEHISQTDEKDTKKMLTADETKVDIPDKDASKETVEEVHTPTEYAVEPTDADVSKSKQSKQYIIPNDIARIIEKTRKITNLTRFEFCSCAIKYYLSKKWHIDKRLKPAKYSDSQWLNTKFVQPVVITFDSLNQIEQVANKFHCKSSTIILQAYLDYCSKIFEDYGIEFNYVFESDIYKDN